MASDDDIDALLDSVARRQRIDWDELDARAGGAERERLKAVRDVARIADFHRSLQADAAGPSTHAAPSTWGPLLVLERVGAGARGEVHRAWDPALQREVALKLMRSREGAEDAGEWLEEARSLARVRDPNVVTIHGAAVHGGRAGLWMEFVRGESLEAAIARRGPLPAREVARVGAQIGRALAAVHAAGALHRDVKPANVLIEPDGRARLADFGLGRRVGAGETRPYSGSPLFMSPERLSGAPASAGDDAYALGVTLYRALSGALPYDADALAPLRAALAARAARPLAAARPDAPAALVAAIERAMHPDPALRFANLAALVETFEALAASAATAPSASPASAPARPAARLVALALALVAVAVLAWTLARERTAERAATAAAPFAAAPQVPSAGTEAGPVYDLSARLVRRTPAGAEPLEMGDAVAPGDRLSLEFRASRPTHVYVLNADDRGECYLLFPQPLFDRTNPLPGDTALMLPGTRGGTESAWTVTSRGGREHFLVVASPEPVAELEAARARLAAPTPGRPVQFARVTSEALDRLRGVGGVGDAPVTPELSGPARLFEDLRVLAGREQGVRGTWVRQIVLRNPIR